MPDTRETRGGGRASPPAERNTGANGAAPRVIDARALLGPANVVRIALDGESYALRITRLGKLILTK